MFGFTMNRFVIIVAISDSLRVLHSFAYAESGHNVGNPSGELASHRSFHQVERDPENDEQAGMPDDHLSGGRGLLELLESTGHAAAKAFETGHQLILPPLKGVERLTNKAADVLRSQKKTITNIMKGIAGTTHDAWKLVQSVEFPGKDIVAVVLPSSVAVANTLTNKIMNFATKTKNAIKTTVAHSLYVTLTGIFSAITSAIRTLGIACIPLGKHSLQPDAGLVNSIDISEGTICGLDSLYPKNNITITKDNGTFLAVTMPWAVKNIVAETKSVDMAGLIGPILQNQPIEAIVQEISCEGTISLQKGTFLKFVALHFELKEISDVNVKLIGGEGGVAAGILDSLTGVLAGLIKTLVNAKMQEMEKNISDYLLGNTSQ